MLSKKCLVPFVEGVRRYPTSEGSGPSPGHASVATPNPYCILISPYFTVLLFTTTLEKNFLKMLGLKCFVGGGCRYRPKHAIIKEQKSNLHTSTTITIILLSIKFSYCNTKYSKTKHRHMWRMLR